MLLGGSRSMQGYGRVDEDLDEYEDDLADEYQDVDSDEYEDEEDVEDGKEKKPMTEEKLKYLDLRQKLKEQARSKLRKENGSTRDISHDKRRASPLENFGSFFGPSTPLIADRVIQQSKSFLETRHLAPKASTSQNDGKKVPMPSNSGSRNGMSNKPPPNQVKSKAQIIKQTRDFYSSLLSDDAEVPKPAIDCVPQKQLVQKPDSRPAQVPAKSNVQRKPSSGIPQARPSQSAPPQKSGPGSRPSLVSSDSKRQLDLRKQPQPNKQIGRSNGSGPVRPVGPKVLPPKQPSSSNDKRAPVGSFQQKAPVGNKVGNKAAGVAKNSMPNGQRPPVVKSQSHGVNNRLEHKRDVKTSGESKIFKKENILASKSQMGKPTKQEPYRAISERDQHIKKQKPGGQFSVHKHSGATNKDQFNKKRRADETFPDEEVDVSSVIRKMFGRPTRYEYDDDDDDDDMCMEVGFDTIQREEMRSARIAKKEDDEELIKIQEEERRERLRKKAKLRR